MYLPVPGFEPMASVFLGKCVTTRPQWGDEKVNPLLSDHVALFSRKQGNKNFEEWIGYKNKYPDTRLDNRGYYCNK